MHVFVCMCNFQETSMYFYYHIYIYVYVNIYKHLPLYSCVHLRLEMISPKDPRITSNGKKCSRTLFSTLFAKNQVFWKQSCFFQSKGLAGIYVYIYIHTVPASRKVKFNDVFG